MIPGTSDAGFAAAVAEIHLPLYAGGKRSAELDAADAQRREATQDEKALRLQLEGYSAACVCGSIGY